MPQPSRSGPSRLTLGRKIVALRRRKAFSAQELADKADMSKGYLSDIENGFRLPSLRILQALAKALRVNIKDLL